MLAWTRSSPTHICGCALAARAAVPASAAYPAAARYAIRDAEVVAAPAATEPAESGAGLGVLVESEPPVGVVVGVAGGVVAGGVVAGGVVAGGVVAGGVVVGGVVVGGVVVGGVLDPVLGGGVRGGGGVEPFPDDFAGGLDECCVGVPRAGRSSTLHCRLVAG
jgi:hypothetical protein